jgi:hypothetical protein
MVKKRSNTSKYQSPSTGEFCTCAQYIAEIMCTRMAQKDNQGTQAYKFWNTDKWKKVYQYQVVLANRLIKKYSEKSVSQAINSNELRRAYSLRHPKVDDVVRRYDIAVKSDELKIKRDLDVKEDPKTRRGTYGKTTKLNKLRSLDGKKGNN